MAALRSTLQPPTAGGGGFASASVCRASAASSASGSGRAPAATPIESPWACGSGLRRHGAFAEAARRDVSASAGKGRKFSEFMEEGGLGPGDRPGAGGLPPGVKAPRGSGLIMPGQPTPGSSPGGIDAAIQRNIASIPQELWLPDQVQAEICPCGGGDRRDTYDNCCKPFLEGGDLPPDAMRLCRARFSAYAKGVAQFIVNTTHPQHIDNESGNLLRETEAVMRAVKFQTLKVTSIEDKGDEAFVVFEATFERAKGIVGVVMEERSRYVKEGGRWLYREATHVELK